MKRKMKRRMKRVVSRSAVAAGRRDFAWRSGKRNPYQSRKLDKINGKRRVQVFFFLFSSITSAALILYHPSFRVDTVNIEGIQRVSETDMRDTIQAILTSNKLLLFPGNSYPLVNTQEISEILQNKFPLESLSVNKAFPDELHVTIEERISTLVYDNGSQYSFISLEGKVVEHLRKIGNDEWHKEVKLVSSTDELGEVVTHEEIISQWHTPDTAVIKKEFGIFPVIYDKRGRGDTINASVVKPETAQGVLDWYVSLRDAGFNTKYFSLENELGGLEVQMQDGFTVFVDVKEDRERQLADIQLVVREQQGTALSYIDVRYPGKIYWR